ncbi:MAG: hypothetical protein ACOC6S_03745 [Chloroflexota bacterium]
MDTGKYLQAEAVPGIDVRPAARIRGDLDERRETALDEAKTADLWAKSEPRYWVTVIAFDFKGYPEVPIELFHRRMSREELAALVVLAPGRTIEDLSNWYPATAVEETFSRDEIKELNAYFKQRGGTRLKIRRAVPPTNDSMGAGAIPAGGCDDVFIFSEEPGYSLPFEVWGYFDHRPLLEQKLFRMGANRIRCDAERRGWPPVAYLMRGLNDPLLGGGNPRVVNTVVNDMVNEGVSKW